jgi:DNA invertase Pin-like site-specific DNA recombinase
MATPNASTTTPPPQPRSAKRVALYARVSTSKCEICGKRSLGHESQTHEYKGQDPEVQLRDLREFAALRNWEITEIYTDTVSGAKDARPGLNRLMADAQRRRFSAVVVWRFDRFARSVSHLLRALEQFQFFGIDFISLSENVDTSTPTGKMVFTVLGAVAELERSLIAERVRAGLRHARAHGKRIGRPRVHASAEKIAELRGRGTSWREICDSLKLSKGTAQRAFYSRPQDQASQEEVRL